MENNLLTHTKHETTHFDVLSDKRQTVKVSFLPFARKINVKLNLNLSNVMTGDGGGGGGGGGGVEKMCLTRLGGHENPKHGILTDAPAPLPSNY